MRQGNWKYVGVLLSASALVGFMPRAAAFTESLHAGEVDVSFFAPDWIWQRREANILFVARNGGDVPVTVDVTLHLPEDREDHFTYRGKASRTLEVSPGESVRGAFAGVLARDGVPCRSYVFRLDVRTHGETKTLDYSLKTIRGAVVGTSTAAIALPVIIAFAFTLVFALVLNRLAERGAWRVKGAPVTSSEDRPGWIDEVPS